METKDVNDVMEAQGPNDQPIVVNLEGIKVNGVDESQARTIAEEAAKRASAAIEEAYKESVTTLEGRNAELQAQLEAVTSERDALAQEKAENQRRAEFDALFDEFAVAREARDELYAAFNGLGVESARTLLKNMNRFSAPAEGSVQEEDEDVSSTKQEYAPIDGDPMKFAEGLAAQFRPYKGQGQDN